MSITIKRKCAMFVLLGILVWPVNQIIADDQDKIYSLLPIRLPHIHRIYTYDLLPAIFEVPRLYKTDMRKGIDENPTYLEMSGGPLRTVGQSASTYGNMMMARAFGKGDIKFNASGGATYGNSRFFNSYRTELMAFYAGLGLTSPWASFHLGLLTQLGDPKDTIVTNPANHIDIRGVRGDLSCNGDLVCSKSYGYSFFAYYTVSKYALLNTLMSKVENQLKLDVFTVSVMRFATVQYVTERKSIDAGVKINTLMVFDFLQKSHPEAFYAEISLNNNYSGASKNDVVYSSVRIGYWFLNAGLSYTGVSSSPFGYLLGLNILAFGGSRAVIAPALGQEFSLSYFNRYPDYALRYVEDEGVLLRASFSI